MMRVVAISLAGTLLAGCGGHSLAPQVPGSSSSSSTQPFGTTIMQRQHQVSRSPRHARYRLVDLGTFGGPDSSLTASFIAPDQYIIDNKGVVTGAADTAQSDPNYPYTNPFFTAFGADPYIQHAFAWRSGDLEDLGALPGTNSSYSLSISANSSYAAGVSTNGTIDSLTGYIESRAVVWKGSRITDIGTFGGNESFAYQVNSRGEAAGSSANATADQYNFYGWGTQMHAFLSRNGAARDLGTLGGPDSVGLFINEAGQVAGFAYINGTPNSSTGLPTFHPFLWDPRSKTMRDLGTIGGTAVFGLNGLNERGQVIGNMTVAGDLENHAFQWNGKRLIDLGTFGGPNSSANTINDAGVVAGDADYPSGCSGPVNHAFLWKNGTMRDLGTLPGMSKSMALAINARDQVVGFSSLCNYYSLTAFLWDRGSMVDLNSLVAHHSDFYMFVALGINDRGVITGLGSISNQFHAFALIPCSDNADCDAGDPNGSEYKGSTNRANVALPETIRALLQRPHRFPCPAICRSGVLKSAL